MTYKIIWKEERSAKWEIMTLPTRSRKWNFL